MSGKGIEGDTQAMAAARGGLLATALSFLIWGLFPLYLKLLHAVPVFQVMSHRVVWCMVFVFGWLAARGQLVEVWRALRNPKTAARLLLSACFISCNWATYVWAAGNDHIVDASLGYFINPLVSVLLGVFLLSEKLNRRQWASVAMAALGVLWLTLQLGRPPWISLLLAMSFGLYGFVRKTVVVESVTGLAVETLLVLPFCLAWLIYESTAGHSAFGHMGLGIDALLVLSGLVTALPLALFSYGVRRIPLTTVGLLQYVTPSMQLIIAVAVFHEPFTSVQLVGFGCIWVALVIYALDGVLRGRAPQPANGVRAAEAS